MTDKEKAIVMAHTGICMLAGDKFQIFHKYVEDIMGRPILTHEIGWLADTIKEKSKADFLALCADESSSENPNKCFDGMTNGEALISLYPDLKYSIQILNGRVVTTIGVASSFDLDWWNAPYKKKSEE